MSRCLSCVLIRCFWTWTYIFFWIRCETLWSHCIRHWVYSSRSSVKDKIEIIKSQSYKITEAYQGSKSQARRRQSHCPTRLGILISAPGRTPPPAGGFRTQSCRSQSYPLANLQLKPLRTSTSRLDHSESSENRCLLSESILDIRNIFDWLFQRVVVQTLSCRSCNSDPGPAQGRHELNRQPVVKPNRKCCISSIDSESKQRFLGGFGVVNSRSL